jgi:ligand-binding sensor domain-containing protein
MAFDNSNTLWAAHSIRGALVYAGTDWQERNEGITSFIVQGMAGDDAALVATSQGGYVRNTDRGAVTYRRVIPMATPGARSFQSAYIEVPRAAGRSGGPAYMYFGTQEGLLRSGDAGATWSPANVGLTNSIIWDIIAKDSLMFVATYNGIHRSTNRGDTWVQANNGNTPLTSGVVLQRSTGHLFALAAGVSRSTDNGANWTTVYITPGFAAATGMDFAPNGNMFVGVFNNGVARSTDNGTTWEMLRNGLDDWAVRDVAVDAQGVVYAATAQGVFRSTTNGENWALTGSGLEAPVVTDLHVDAQGYLFAGTMAGGVYRSALPTQVEGPESPLPPSARLAQNYPNPFNPVTTIEFAVPVAGVVSLKVLDPLGREVATLVEGLEQAGVRRVAFDATGLPSGVYFYRLRVAGGPGSGFTETRSMVFLK